MLEQEKKDAVTITIKGAISMEMKTSLKKAIEVARFLADEGETVGHISHSGSTVTTAMPKVGGSALEVIRTSKAKTFPQQIVALAYHVTQRDKSEFFDPKDVQLLLRRMGNPPQNFGRDLLKATDILGYMAKEAPGRYILTELGKEMVSKGFDASSEGKTRRRKVRGRKKTKDLEA